MKLYCLLETLHVRSILYSSVWQS